MVGENDPESAIALDRLNHQATLLHKLDYPGAVKNLQQMTINLADNPYALSRVRNELADLLTNRTLEIEAAIAIDQQLLNSTIPDTDHGNGTKLYQPRTMAAVNRLLLDKDHFTEYVAIDSTAIRSRAKERLETNLLILDGQVRPRKTSYTKSFLDETLRQVQSDINATYAETEDRKRLLSRLIRIDYELTRLTGQSTGAYEKFRSGEIKVEDIDLGEITFLELSNYFSYIFNITKDIYFAENALNSIYLPYLKIKDPKTRWKYNKIINDHISKLIDANYSKNRLDELLYYTSLNKSRMLLEERKIFDTGKEENKNISNLFVGDSIPNTEFGLPSKAWFKNKLATSPQFLDFYVGGSYVIEKTINTLLTRVERSVMPLNSRNSGRVSSNEPTEVFKDDALYITQVNNGRVTAIKVSGTELSALRSEMERSYAAISNSRNAIASPTLQKIKSQLQLTDNLTVSPDKWISTHPLDFHLQAKSVRAVNFFTSRSSDKLNQLSVAGFINPIMDLPGADNEGDVIKALIPQANIIRHEAARKSALTSVSGANVIHLSMHGNFNPDDPTLSKLVFAGAAKDDSTNDPNALYATEMSSVAALRNRDLVFAAACQTGLLAADHTNVSELTGILRPLTANRNKNLILSLWNVSDRATGDFVKAFYQKLTATRDVKESFHYAQDQLRINYPDPYYWAAFYLSQSD